MTMAAVIESRAADEARSQPSRIARVEILHDLAAAEPVWRSLEQSAAFCTPYQRFDLLSAWQRHVGAREGVEPFIIIARDRDGEPLLLLPLGVSGRVARVASFLGGKHATFNMAPWQGDFFNRATKAD